MAPETGVNASLIVPLLALVVISAVDSVQEDDPLYYRYLVGGFGVSALGLIMIVVSKSIIPDLSILEQIQFTDSDIEIFTAISVVLITFLIVFTTLFEVGRGLEEPKGRRLAYRLGGGISLLCLCLVAYSIAF